MDSDTVTLPPLLKKTKKFEAIQETAKTFLLLSSNFVV